MDSSEVSVPYQPGGSGPETPRPDPGSISALPVPPPVAPERTLGTTQWGMIAFLLSEAALFSTLIVAYITFLGKDTVGPTPREALSLPLVLVTSICLLSSSATIHQAEKNLRQGTQAPFRMWWGLTILLGVVFLLGTGYEWSELISRHGLTISRNLFGSTYYTLVGFHGLHVTIGILSMLTVLGLALRGQVAQANMLGVEMVSWYWHFVDGVWVVVFSVVYLIGR
jgi:cytochrome c oxidase subunit 3